MIRQALMVLAALSLCLAVGCKKKDDGGGDESAASGGDKSAKSDKSDKSDKGSGASGPKVHKYASGADLDKDFRSVEGKAFMDKFGMDGKIHVTGKVKRTMTEMDESMKVWLDVDGKKWISLSFKDKGAKVKEAKVAKDADLTALCGIGGSTGTYIMLIDCELK